MKKQTIKRVLASAEVDAVDAELLLAHAMKKPREFVLAHPETTVPLVPRLVFSAAVKKRKRNAPLAYLIGHKAFFGLDFLVNKHTLIPRPETELLVEAAIDRLKKINGETTLIDVGAGSGCIPIAITKTRKHKNIKTFATDISKKALRVAKKNAQNHNVDIIFLHGNLLDPFLQSFELRTSNFELFITANLPYLTEEQFQSEPTIRHEPKTALVAGNGGLALYEELLKQLQQLVIGYRLRVTGFFEIDPSQSDRITALIKKHLPTATVEIQKDLRGQDRLITISA